MAASLNVSNICIRATTFSIQLGCIIACLYIIVTQFEKYYQNDDATVMHVKTFSKAGSNVVPSLTLCFKSRSLGNPLEGLYNKSSIQSKLQMSASEYREILLGKLEGGKDMEEISSFDFEKNTLDIWNYLETFQIRDTTENEYIWKYDKTVKNFTFEYVDIHKRGWNEKQNIIYGNKIPLVPNYLDPNIKCFTHHHSLDGGMVTESIKLHFSVRNLASLEGGKLYICVHHLQQLMRNMKSQYKIEDLPGISHDSSNSNVLLDLMYLKVIKRRHDAKEACDKDLKNDDQEWMKHVAENVSCLPPYWSSVYANNVNFSLCRSKKELESVARYLVEGTSGRNVMFEQYKPPCQIMQVLANSHSTKYYNEGILQIKLRFRYLKSNTLQSCQLYSLYLDCPCLFI